MDTRKESGGIAIKLTRRPSECDESTTQNAPQRATNTSEAQYETTPTTLQVYHEDESVIASDFIAMLDRWHAAPEVWDSALDAEIHRQYYEVLSKNTYINLKQLPYFSPSSANSCKRELYVKLTGAKRDIDRTPPHQGRWRRMGTAFGDVIQRDLLFIEKHHAKKLGEAPAFVPERTPEGYPMWEDFAKLYHIVEHGGHRFALYGTPDGVLRYKGDSRVGLEVKSKQTTSAQTSRHSMKTPKEDHARQVVAYSIMYGVNDYIIMYGNLSKKSWVMDDDEYAKSPDARAFHIHVTDADRTQLLGMFAEVLDAVKAQKPPALNLEKWTFNSYKEACALSLSDEEFAQIESQVKAVMKSSLPDWRKKNYRNALIDIVYFRENAKAGAA